MKRIIAITISMLLLLFFVSCGNNSDSASSITESSIIENTSSENVSSEETSSDSVSPELSNVDDVSEESSEETSNEETSSEDVSSEDIFDDISEVSSEESSSEPSDEPSDESSGATSKNESSESEECTHKNTIIKNNKTATCARDGYTGDEFCLNCQKTIKQGETIKKSETHGETKLVNYKEATTTATGYTGDTVCTVCNKVLKNGNTIPMVQNGSTFIDGFGNSVFVPAGEDVFDYTLNNAKNNIPNADHPYVSIDLESKYSPGEFTHYEWDTLAIEKETFRLINEERVKAGVAPLEWCEEAYYFAYTRAREQEQLWGHTRPNGKGFNHVFSEYDVFPAMCGENLYAVNAVPTNYETYAVKSWVNSPGHYKNMINEKYTRTVIAVYYSETNRCSYFVQLFFA